ncbi:MAG: alpha-ketoglutarate-dependent dioxygenase AlkB [Patescibacteria group bacterium]
MIKHIDLSELELNTLLESEQVKYTGHKNLKIYCHLSCSHGKRMKRENRLFFVSEIEAKEAGFRPCGHCMREQYLIYKNNNQNEFNKDRSPDNIEASKSIQLIPQDEIIFQTANSLVKYESEFLTAKESEDLYEYLLNNLDWQNDKHQIYGKVIITKRKIVWFADSELNYNYSGTERVAAGNWDQRIYEIKQRLEKHTGFTFNSCLLNLYHDGNEGMSWHGDDQNHLNPAHTTVAIVSLGAERYFKLRENANHANQHKVSMEQGSLLLMCGQTQKFWQHEIPKMAAIKTPRISLTWRTMAVK